MTKFQIQITSDIVCPWCYIGHTRLSRAITNHLKTFPTDTFVLTYLPYYLQPPPPQDGPSFPIKSTPRREMYASKFGPERARQMEAMMSEVSRGEGLNFKFGGNSGQSRNGHRLVRYAQTHSGTGGEEAQNKTMLGLWRRYFEQEVDITLLDVLVQTGVEAGLGNEKEIKTFLESSELGQEVDEVAEEERMKGITGVPHYEIQGMWEVSGAQDAVAFEKLFKRWKDREEGSGMAAGRLC
jgi:predicted DsbA family dithiol-disulfide isomerase